MFLPFFAIFLFFSWSTLTKEFSVNKQKSGVKVGIEKDWPVIANLSRKPMLLSEEGKSTNSAALEIESGQILPRDIFPFGLSRADKGIYTARRQSIK